MNREGRMTPMTRIQQLVDEVSVILGRVQSQPGSLHGAEGGLEPLAGSVRELKRYVDDYAQTFPRFAYSEESRLKDELG